MPSSIINSDDGVVSGTSGLKSSGGDDGVLVFQSKGTETARINTDKQIVAAAGTNSLPALTTTGDLNTGIFFPAADTIAFAEGGAEAMRITSDGNVGIGNNNPATVDGNTNTKLTVGDSTTNDGALGVITTVRKGTSGNLAIGSFQFANTNLVTTDKRIAAINGRTGTNTNDGVMAFTTASAGTLAERMRIDSSGNVLVGTTSTPSGYSGNIIVGTSGGGFFCNGSSAGNYGTISNQAMVFFTNAAERARITSGGDFLVGTTTAISNAAMVVSRSQQTLLSTIENTSGSGIEARLDIRSRGKVSYFGVTVNAGNAVSYMLFQEEDGGNSYFWTDNSGNFRISSAFADIGTTGGTVVGNQTSDERLKDISGPVSYGLADVLAIEPITFTMQDDPSIQKIGFSAQQVQPIVPEAVYDTGECIDGYDTDPENHRVQTPKSDRTKLAMDYTQLIPVLVNAVKELKAELDTVKAELATLKGQ